MKHSILYHEGKAKKLYSWRVWCEGEFICTEYGTVDGEKTQTRKEAKPKNVGKSNATSPEQQAQIEAQAMWTHKLERKYRQTPDAARETIFLPMLAYDRKKIKKPLPYPVDTQPKLNGVRCLAFWKDGSIFLMSRSGKEYSVAHISGALERMLPEGWVLDGELYVHGMALQDIVARAKKHRPGSDGSIQIKYRVYDMFHGNDLTVPWDGRSNQIDLFFEMGGTEHFPNAYVVKLDSDLVNNEEELTAKLLEYETQGYEGAIIRLHKGLYKLGHRSRDLLKLKSFKDQEFRIVGYTEAKGNDKGTVVWSCVTKDGREFGVRPMGTREQRAEWFQNGDKYIGSLLTVKYQELTKDGIPHGGITGIAIRDPMTISYPFIDK